MGPPKCHWDQIVGLILRSARCTSKLDPGITFAIPKKASASKVQSHVASTRGAVNSFLPRRNKSVCARNLNPQMLQQKYPNWELGLHAPVARADQERFQPRSWRNCAVFKVGFPFKNRGTTLTNPCTCWSSLVHQSQPHTVEHHHHSTRQAPNDYRKPS